MLLRFEILKLIRSGTYLIVLSLPWIFLLILIIYYKLNISQSFFDDKLFFHQGQPYNNSNPYYFFVSQYLAGLFILLFPIQSILAMGLSHQIDLKHNGWMLIKSIQVKPWIWHSQSLGANLLLLAASMGSGLLLFMFCLHHLPMLNEDIIYEGHLNPWWGITTLFWWGFLSAIPMHIFHYWISFLNARLSTSLLMTVIFLILSYSVVKNSPYELLSVSVASGLAAIEEALVLAGRVENMPIQIWGFEEIGPSLLLMTICIIHAFFKTR